MEINFELLLIKYIITKTIMTIDFHVHFGMQIHENLDEYESELQRILNYCTTLKIQRAIIITPTYQQSRYDNNKSHIKATNAKISQLISAHPDRLLGLAGVSIHRDDAVEVAKECLELPGIIGIKLRNFTLDPETNGNYFGPPMTMFERFEKLIKLAHRKKTIVLAHFSDDVKLETTMSLLQLMNKYPDAKLIIAHSGVSSFIGLEGLNYIGQEYEKFPQMPRNIYIDIAKSFGMGSLGIHWDPKQEKYIHTAKWSDAKDYIQAWKTFGIDRVLYGSDYGCCDGDHDHKCNHKFDELEISDCPDLTPEEKQGIYQLNATKLFSRSD